MRVPPVPASLAAVVAVLAAALPAGATAGVYKCIDADGRQPVYQDSPCPAGRELRNFDTEPAEVSVIPFSVPPPSPPPPASKPAKAPAAAKPDRAKNAPAAADVGQRKFIVPGMTEGEVVAHIGNPDMTSGPKGGKTARWSYLPAAGDPQTITTITFDYGKVVNVERKVMR